MQSCIRIHPKDSVAVALMPLKAGTWISSSSPGRLSGPGSEPGFFLREDIPAGHKFALTDIACGRPVIKYGEPIGIACEPIPQGAHVHTHNLKTALDGVLSYSYHPVHPVIAATGEAFFQGYRRSDGKAGVRNELWIIPTVGCVNDVAAAIAKRAQDLVSGSIDTVVSFSHPYGCSQMGEDQENTRKILAGLIRHPNAGGVLVLGLGCENSGVDELKKYLGDYDPGRIRFLVAQECEDEIEEGVLLLHALAEQAEKDRRELISCSELIVGMKCGGSDGFSGITANPAVGGFSDLLISKGGTTILTEVPEMFGAEALLMNRCANEELFGQTVRLINDFKDYFTSHGQTIYENPSPGNKKGGISTLEDKSLGCTQKSGSAPVRGVLSYAEPVKEHGLNLLSAPGNDLVASTALAASGAQIILFTTGRGTPFASPVPTVKLSSNTPLYEKKKNWIDFNCGVLLEGTSLSVLSGQLFDYVLRVAGGEQVKSEAAGFHDMAIFKQGVTL